MTNYRNGADLERATKKLFEANGYFVVKAAGSKGPADLVAMKVGELILVQCKTTGRIGPADRRQLVDLSHMIDAERVVASWHKQGRAARAVRLQTVCLDADEQTTRLIEWTPDWAIEVATTDHRGDRTA